MLFDERSGSWYVRQKIACAADGNCFSRMFRFLIPSALPWILLPPGCNKIDNEACAAMSALAQGRGIRIWLEAQKVADKRFAGW